MTGRKRKRRPKDGTSKGRRYDLVAYDPTTGSFRYRRSGSVEVRTEAVAERTKPAGETRVAIPFLPSVAGHWQDTGIQFDTHAAMTEFVLSEFARDKLLLAVVIALKFGARVPGQVQIWSALNQLPLPKSWPDSFGEGLVEIANKNVSRYFELIEFIYASENRLHKIQSIAVDAIGPVLPDVDLDAVVSYWRSSEWRFLTLNFVRRVIETNDSPARHRAVVVARTFLDVTSEGLERIVDRSSLEALQRLSNAAGYQLGLFDMALRLHAGVISAKSLSELQKSFAAASKADLASCLRLRSRLRAATVQLPVWVETHGRAVLRALGSSRRTEPEAGFWLGSVGLAQAEKTDLLKNVRDLQGGRLLAKSSGGTLFVIALERFQKLISPSENMDDGWSNEIVSEAAFWVALATDSSLLGRYLYNVHKINEITPGAPIGSAGLPRYICDALAADDGIEDDIAVDLVNWTALAMLCLDDGARSGSASDEWIGRLFAVFFGYANRLRSQTSIFSSDRLAPMCGDVLARNLFAWAYQGNYQAVATGAVDSRLALARDSSHAHCPWITFMAVGRMVPA